MAVVNAALAGLCLTIEFAVPGREEGTVRAPVAEEVVFRVIIGALEGGRVTGTVRVERNADVLVEGAVVRFVGADISPALGSG